MRVDSSSQWPHVSSQFATGLLDADAATPTKLTSFHGINDPRRYAVYKNNVTVGLIRALEANFPAIRRLLGDEFFAAMARVFVSQNPPRSKLMFEYGAAFPRFLEAFEPAQPYPYLPDVARTETLWRESFHEADAGVLSGADLAAIPPEKLAELRFQVHPAARLMRSSWAIGSIYIANRSEQAVGQIDPHTQETVLITRPEFECSLRILSPAQSAFFSTLIEGATLNDAVLAALEIDHLFDLTMNFSGIIESGAFTCVKL